jgi:protein-tyrosine phosphatase
MNNHFKRVTAAAMCCMLLAGCQTYGAFAEETAVSEEVSVNTITVESQTLGMEKLSNARQLGGYITEDGMRVKSNVLLRSGKLSAASEADLQKLHDEYNVTEIIDLRTTDEIASAPDPEVEGAVNVRVQVIDENSDSSAAAMTAIYSNSDNPAAALIEMYRAGTLSDSMYIDIFDSEAGLAGYRAFVDELLNHEEGAILWHCTGGKDRAGTAAVVILTLLGVDKETVLDDFELTNQFNATSIEYMKSKAAELTDNEDEINGVATLTGVSRQLMENLFDYAEAESGSMLEFLKAKLNITDDEIATLRSKYLESAE